MRRSMKVIGSLMLALAVPGVVTAEEALAVQGAASAAYRAGPGTQAKGSTAGATLRGTRSPGGGAAYAKAAAAGQPKSGTAGGTLQATGPGVRAFAGTASTGAQKGAAASGTIRGSVVRTEQ